MQSLTGQRSTALEPSEGFKLKSMTAIFNELLQSGPVAVGIVGVGDNQPENRARGARHVPGQRIRHLRGLGHG
ncbi:MAG: hypothetical protein FJY99_09025 [Candidatus Sericytochromatia bacterium]|nr:hypothetical protein [Candidatus Tanganyikabacteria bacterium]